MSTAKFRRRTMAHKNSNHAGKHGSRMRGNNPGFWIVIILMIIVLTVAV